VSLASAAELEESVARYLSQLDTADRQEPTETLAAKVIRLTQKLTYGVRSRNCFWLAQTPRLRCGISQHQIGAVIRWDRNRAGPYPPRKGHLRQSFKPAEDALSFKFALNTD
jgi:hypothetical protein